MSWDGLVQQVLDKHHIKIDAEKLKKVLPAQASMSGGQEGVSAAAVSVSDAFRCILHANITELVSAPGQLPRNTGSLPQGVLEAPALVQIQTSRDATQPLRPCADMDDADALLNAANQKATNHRLLRLTVSDGAVEVPAIELKTLRLFHGIPTPGEKLLLKPGTEVRNGMIILTDDTVEALGGSEKHLRDEFMLRKQRNALLSGGGAQVVGGLEGAPKFAPLEAVTNVKKHAATPNTGNSHRQQASSSGSAALPRESSHHQQEAQSGRGQGRGNAAHSGDRGSGRGGRHESRGGRGGGDRGGRGGGGRGAGRGDGGRGDAGQPRQQYRDPAVHPASTRPPVPPPPKFTDADFPSLGGDW